MTFSAVSLGPSEINLRNEIRGFLATELPLGSYRPALGMSGVRSRDFSRKLAERGWVGTSVPEEYGGKHLSAVERFILAEELFSSGAPVSGHWVADRQTVPMLLAFGTHEQKEEFLPSICSGETWFSIGMSEPDAGSDLASVRTTAERVEGGWVVNGTKIWTSGAADNDFFVVLCRTSPVDSDRHEGLSQLIVDLHAEGVQISPIVTLDGAAHFYEVAMQKVYVPSSMVLGSVGKGWQQVNSELGFERSGPERYLSPYQLFNAFVGEVAATTEDTEAHCEVGRIASKFWVLRQMSLSLAWSIDRGEPPGVEAAMMKDVGTTFEQSVVRTIQSFVELSPDPNSSDLFESLLAECVLMSPAWTIRGGTTEVLRTVASRSLRSAVETHDADELTDAVARLLRSCGAPASSGADGDVDRKCWKTLAEMGLAWVGVPELAGGDGGDVADACRVIKEVARNGVRVPIAETFLAGLLLARCGLAVNRVTATVGVASDGRIDRFDGENRVSFSLEKVPWVDESEEIVVLVPEDASWWVARLDTSELRVTPGSNIAGEPRCGVEASGVPIADAALALAPADLTEGSVELLGALVRVVAMAGAMEAISEMTVAYASGRRQFGRSIDRFQAVQHHLVRMASESAVSSMAAALAVRSFSSGDEEFAVPAAKVVADAAAEVVGASAHQVHGAIGMTEEYRLHRYTRPLWSWRQEFGSARSWSKVIGTKLVRAGAERLWERLTSDRPVAS